MAKENWQDLYNVILLNKGKIIGCIIGVVFGILILLIGFFKTLVILLFALLGYYLGSRFDREGDFKKFLDKILPQQFR